MKKIILLSVTMLATIFTLVSFSGKKKMVTMVKQSSSAFIECAPAGTAPLITAAVFQARYVPSAVMVRKNVDLLSLAEINDIKTGITAMKALPYTNPTSWEYQAAIHGTLLPDNLPSWNNCHKAGQGFFFLAWHRMYVYFFERILRAKSGSPNLTLPYWNCKINAVMHAEYRNNSAGNPLYDATRNPAINNGGALPASITTGYNNALDFIPYYDFQSSLNGPHGSVHTTINGNMASTASAAKDPAFWLHHCNVDRLWEEWLRKCKGRANPNSDNAWLTNSYTFFDENGTAVNMTGSQVVKTATQLNYKYDFTATPILLCLPIKWVFISKQLLLRKASPFILKGQTQRANFTTEKPDQLESFINTKKRTAFNFTSATTAEKLILTLEGIKIDKLPAGVVEVYLNLPAGVRPSSNSKYFVGLLDLFSVEHHSRHNMKGMEEDKFELDASKVAQAQDLTLTDLKKADVLLHVRGNSLRGIEVKTEAAVSIKNIQFSLSQFRKE